MLVRNASLAVEHGLVDSLMYQDQVEDELKRRVGWKLTKKSSSSSTQSIREAFPTYKDRRMRSR